MSDNVSAFPRAVRPAPDPLGLYLRVGRNDHRELSNLLASGGSAGFGAVFDPTLVERQKELREQVTGRRLDAILDPKTQPAAMVGGYSEALGELPWGLGRQHSVDDFVGMPGRRLVASIGDFVLEHGFTQVIAPTHVLRSVEDPWLAVDADSTRQLRNHLDRHDGGRVPIIYSLALPYAVFRDQEQRRRLIGELSTLPIGALWLKVEGFGSDATPTGVAAYLAASGEFHGLGIPVIADHVGGVVGLSLLAFGAAGGMAHGVTSGERFNAAAWRRPRPGSSFGTSRRVYVPAIDAMLKPSDANALIGNSTRAKAMFGCADPGCCPRGVRDMLASPVRHFLCQRVGEVGRLGQIPEQIRPQRFLDQNLRPMTDRALAASTINWDDTDMAKRMQQNRKRLDALRIMLGGQAERGPDLSFAQLPLTRAAREGRR